MANPISSQLEARIIGSFRTRFWLELFGNSIYFPIANILLEMLREGIPDYFRAPDPYVIVIASLTQAYWLTRWQTTEHPRRFWGNLIGPAVYTLIESLVEGTRFFAAPHHLAYWGFGLAIGMLQTIRSRTSATPGASLIVIENVIRTSIIFFMYIVFETYANPAQTVSVGEFFSDSSHQFTGLVVLFLGISIGLANLTSNRYLEILSKTSAQLKTYSEWLLGRDLLEQSFVNPSVLNLARRERAVMFMDIRGFTHWSEKQSPEIVVNLLDGYYQLTESILARHAVIKSKLSADEVMAVFPSAEAAIYAALDLRAQLQQSLSKNQLGAGIGLHVGVLIEGLLGSADVKFYDVVGDTVNTAKRIESAALSGEILISENILSKLGGGIKTGVRREINAKGKEQPLAVYPLEG